MDFTATILIVCTLCLTTLPRVSADNGANDIDTRPQSMEQSIYEIFLEMDRHTRNQSTEIDFLNDRLDDTTTRLEELENDRRSCQQSTEELIAAMTQLNHTIQRLEERLAETNDTSSELPTGADCSEGPASGSDGIYTIAPADLSPFRVHCQTEGGYTWAVIQQRYDGTTDFNRNWYPYKEGFGNIGTTTNYWLGLERMHRMTRTGKHILRVTLEDWNGNTTYAEYAGFRIDSEVTRYRFTYTSYMGGTAGDAMEMGNYDHRNQPFSTRDNENDPNGNDCAHRYQSGWWYHTCVHANLNGMYYTSPDVYRYHGIIWGTWKGYAYSLKCVSMMIRQSN